MAAKKKTQKRGRTAPKRQAETKRGANAIESLREQIDRVDRDLHALLNQRARLARQVGISKGQQGRLVDFYRPERDSQWPRYAP